MTRIFVPLESGQTYETTVRFEDADQGTEFIADVRYGYLPGDASTGVGCCVELLGIDRLELDTITIAGVRRTTEFETIWWHNFASAVDKYREEIEYQIMRQLRAEGAVR